MKYKWKTVISVTIIFTIIIVFLKSNKGDDTIDNSFFEINLGEQIAQEKENVDVIDRIDQTDQSIVTTQAVVDSSNNISNMKLYTNSKHKFLFEYPGEFVVSSFEDGLGETILIQNKSADKSVQIFITLFNEQEPISTTRILKDLPSLLIKNEKEGFIGSNKAIAFLSDHETLGNTYEIWFVYNNNLYQIMTKIETAQFLVDIMKTWKEIE